MFGGNRCDRVLPVKVESCPSVRGGRIGVGTWATQAEFKDIQVTRDGRTIFASDFGNGIKGWETAGGRWLVRDSALCQVGSGEGVRALAGDRPWNDYTLTLKARKTGGGEGFLIFFTNHSLHEKYWWNLGGFGNTRHVLEARDCPTPRSMAASRRAAGTTSRSRSRARGSSATSTTRAIRGGGGALRRTAMVLHDAFDVKRMIEEEFPGGREPSTPTPLHLRRTNHA